MSLKIYNAEERGTVFDVQGKLNRVFYMESMVSKEFIEPLRLACIYHIYCCELREHLEKEELIFRLGKLFKTLEGNIDELPLEPVTASTMLITNELHPHADDDLNMGIKIIHRDTYLMVMFNNILINSNELMGSGIYMVDGKPCQIYMSPTIAKVKSTLNSDWNTLFALLVSYALSLEGYLIPAEVLNFIASSLAEVRMESRK